MLALEFEMLLEGPRRCPLDAHLQLCPARGASTAAAPRNWHDVHGQKPPEVGAAVRTAAPGSWRTGPRARRGRAGATRTAAAGTVTPAPPPPRASPWARCPGPAGAGGAGPPGTAAPPASPSPRRSPPPGSGCFQQAQLQSGAFAEHRNAGYREIMSASIGKGSTHSLAGSSRQNKAEDPHYWRWNRAYFEKAHSACLQSRFANAAAEDTGKIVADELRATI